MSSNSILSAVQHYQRSIEKSLGDEKRLLYCVEKLYKMPITVAHLQQTGVGRTVNALRKYNGELSVAAEAVVNKWKELVAAESDLRADNHSSDNEQDVGDEKEDEDSSDKEDNRYSENNNHISNDHNSKPHNGGSLDKNKSNKHNEQKEVSASKSSSSNKSHKSEHRDKSKEHHSKRDKQQKEDEHEHKKHKSHKEKSEKSNNHNTERKEKDESAKQKRSKDENKTCSEQSLKKREHSSSSASKHNEKHHSSSSSSSSKHKHHDKLEDEKKDKLKSKPEYKSQNHHSSSKTQPLTNTDACEPSTSTAALTASTLIDRKRRHKEVSAIDKGSSSKKQKSDTKQDIQKNTKEINEINEEEGGDVDDGIDSSMGANFAEVLGMLNMPQKKAKKTLNSIKQNTSPKSAKPKPIVENESNKTSSISKINGIRSFEQPSTSSYSMSSIRNLERKPDLLASNAKLAPLDPSIALELPMISNNYKPLPLNPTVMDCVFNSSTSSSSRAPPRMLSDAEALSHGISSKTMRTKVYSGVKTGQLLQVPSLFDLCIRILQKNIDALEYTGGVPFDVLRPVLERASPHQLFTFEEYNPYLMEDSDVLWQLHVQRNYRGHKREEMETWREMFMRCQEDQERRLNRLAENIKQSQKAIALPVRKTQLAFVDSLVKPPRNVIRKQEQHGTKSKLVATPAARVAALSNVTPNAGRQGDARLRVAAAFSHDPAQVSHASSRPHKAPLMAKTLKFMRGRHKR